MYRFLIVGCINTALGLVLMFFLYNVLNFGYWGSSAPSYVIGSIFSYIVNKRYTFSYKKRDKMSMVRFVVVQVLSYFIAYMIARPLTFTMLSFLHDSLGIELRFIEQIAMLVGMGFFMVFGYMGQRFFVFRSKKDDITDEKDG